MWEERSPPKGNPGGSDLKKKRVATYHMVFEIRMSLNRRSTVDSNPVTLQVRRQWIEMISRACYFKLCYYMIIT